MIHLATTENDERIHHYAGVVKDPRFEWVGTIPEPYDESNLTGIDGLIISCDNHLHSRIAIAACGSLGIPVFHILDGVVDWRTTFENPKYDAAHGGIPLFQPLVADHVFTLGPLQQLQMASLGNNNAHASGLPRLDGITRRPCSIGDSDAPPSLLVTTANTPWATELQREHLAEEFRQLGAHLSEEKIETTYRISQELAQLSGIIADHTGSATEALENCSALITTPSTMAVEAMLVGIPTLIFDPFALPVFTPSAWMGTNWQSVIASLPSLLSPTKSLATYQDDLCISIAIGDGGATQRISDKIVSVIENHEKEKLQKNKESAPDDEQTIRGLSATVAALENRLLEASNRQKETDRTIQRPNFQFASKTAARFLKQSIKSLKE